MNILTDEMIQDYRKNGVIKISKIITEKEAHYYRNLALEFIKDQKKLYGDKNYANRLTIRFNLWLESSEWKKLTLHPVITNIAKKLAGIPLRLWHDHILVKKPKNNLATEFHQDQTKWPHDNSYQSLTVWVALQDTPIEKGCLTFIPRSHLMTDLPDVKLSVKNGYKTVWSDIEWASRLTIPLKAGDCTFHHCRTIHAASPNMTDDWRVAHTAIFMDENTIFNGKMNLSEIITPDICIVGEKITGKTFPTI